LPCPGQFGQEGEGRTPQIKWKAVNERIAREWAEKMRLRSFDILKIFMLAAALVLFVWPQAIECSEGVQAALGGRGDCVMGAGILLMQSDHNSITGNSVMGNRMGIFLQDSNNNAVAGNSISNNRGYGLFLNGSSGNSILHNDLCHNAYSGISLWDSFNNSLTYNEASYNYENGISLWDSAGNKLSNNNAIFNGQWGIYLFKSHENYLLANNASENGENGLIFCESDANSLGGNVAGNNLGIFGDLCLCSSLAGLHSEPRSAQGATAQVKCRSIDQPLSERSPAQCPPRPPLRSRLERELPGRIQEENH
jgi:parallel beta-helix repeat protein